MDGSGPLKVHLWGGPANAPAPAKVSGVPANSIAGAGFKGVALRDAATGNYVKRLSQTSGGANADYSLSVADLAAYANAGKTYTLGFLDYDHGSWGWVGLDNVVIPGVPMQAKLALPVPAIIVGRRLGCVRIGRDGGGFGERELRAGHGNSAMLPAPEIAAPSNPAPAPRRTGLGQEGFSPPSKYWNEPSGDVWEGRLSAY